MSRIVTVTANPVLDVTTTTARVVPTKKLRCSAPEYEPGGGGINVSRAIHFLGGQSLALHLCGGPAGQQVCRLLDAEGVAHRPLPIDGTTRQGLMVSETETGQQFRFNLPGPTVSEAEWRQCLTVLADLDPAPRYLIGSGSLPPSVPETFYAELARTGRELGAKVVIDTSGPALARVMETGVYLLKPNLRELEEMSGSRLETEVEQERAACRLIEQGAAEVVVVSLGQAGAMLVTAGHAQFVRAPSVGARSTVGAGDSMVAGMAMALDAGVDLREAICRGVAAGCAACLTTGAELCRREDYDRLLARMIDVGTALTADDEAT